MATPLLHLSTPATPVAGYFLLSEVAQPLTAPVRPPTMRRSNRVKNTNAGITVRLALR
jgi:hypothetical protein